MWCCGVVASCGGVAAGSPASGLGSEAAAAFGRGSVRAGLRLGRLIATICGAPARAPCWRVLGEFARLPRSSTLAAARAHLHEMCRANAEMRAPSPRSNPPDGLSRASLFSRLTFGSPSIFSDRAGSSSTVAHAAVADDEHAVKMARFALDVAAINSIMELIFPRVAETPVKSHQFVKELTKAAKHIKNEKDRVLKKMEEDAQEKSGKASTQIENGQ